MASFLGLIIVGLCLSSILANRDLYKHDVVRTRINQNLRSALDIMSLNTRQAGEALPEYFPAIEIINGSGANSDELIIRRNLYENEILNVCQDLVAATTTTSIRFAYTTTNIACDRSSDLIPYRDIWRAFAVQEGGNTFSYIYNRTSRKGEFFKYDTVPDDGATMTVHRYGGGAWKNAYPGDGLTAAMYIIEEFKFKLVNSTLQIVKNEDTANTLNVVDGITTFQVEARMSDDTIKTTLSATDNWIDIKYIQVTMTGEDTFAKRPVRETISAKLFPRNILSH